MRASHSIILVAVLSSATLSSRADGQEIVEVLKDAQVTNRDGWKRGTAAFRLEITSNQRDGVAVLEGDLRWDGSDMILKYKGLDPDGVRFRDRARAIDLEWNYVARNSKKVITYIARHDALIERRSDPNAFEPLYDLSPLTTFSQCCPPYGVQGRPWQDMIGPSPSTPDAFKTSNFSHDKLPDGDCVQTRADANGYKFVTRFSARHNYAVGSATSFDPAGQELDKHEYQYSNSDSGQVIPIGVTTVSRSPDLKKSTTFRYTFSKVQLPGSVSPVDFTRDAVLARIDRETDRKKRSQAKAKATVDDALLDRQAKSLRESGSARPKP